MNSKLISVFSNIAIVLNVVAGGMGLGWWLIPIFALVHIGLRLWFLKIDQKQNANTNQTQTMIAPPQVRQFASIITGVIVAGLAYAIGLGVHILLQRFAS